MRFTAATVALFAGLAAALPGADTTVYETDEVTITSCGPTVTDCPARHSATPSAPAAVTTPAGVAASSVPTAGASYSASSGAGAQPSQSNPVPGAGAQPSAPAGSAPSAAPQVVTVTSCVPTTFLSTIAPKPTASSPVGAGNNGGVPHVPSSSQGWTSTSGSAA